MSGLSDPIGKDRAPAVVTALLARNWWAIALRGAAAIVFGIVAFVVPGVTLAVLVLLYGSYALLDGLFNIVAAITGWGGARSWWSLLVGGLVSVIAGLAAFLVPGLTALLLVYLIGAWAVVRGVLELIAAVRLRREIDNEWWLALSGALSIVFGTLVVLAPGAGALALVLWIGAYAVGVGILLVALGLRLRGLRAAAPGADLRRAA